MDIQAIEKPSDHNLLWDTRDGQDGQLKFLCQTFKDSYFSNLARYPDQPFISWNGARGERRSETFISLHRDVALAAGRLDRHAVRTDVIVLIGANSYENVVFTLAALLLGRTICPINPDDGLTRIRNKIELLSANCSIWLDPKLSVPLSSLTHLQMTLEPLTERSSPPEFAYFQPAQPMVLIFTSGSTGYSKIVEQTEIGILTNADALIERHGLRPGVCLATPLPIFHVNALEFAVFATLLSGARLVLCETSEVTALLEIVERESCHILSIVPPILRLLTERLMQWERYDFRNLRYIVTAAAPLSVDLLKLAIGRLGVPIVQGYGLSEAVNFSCLMPTGLPREEYLKWATEFKWPSIGTQLRGSQVFILNEFNEELGEGMEGEICIRGPTVMLGYRGEGGRQVFSGAYLHTGDLGLFHLDSKGESYFFVTGRTKETIKRNGMTVSLREVDDWLSRFEEFNFDAIAVAFANDWSGEDVGVVVRRADAVDDHFAERFKQHLCEGFPQHLRPSVVIRSGRPLRTASGKPSRWQFVGLFEGYRRAVIGPNFFVYKEEDRIPRETELK